MALSFSRVTSGGLAYRVVGAEKETITDVTFDSSYPTNGEAYTAADLGLQTVHSIASCNVKAVGGSVNVASVFADETNAKLKVYDETPAEVANTADLSALIVRVRARGV